MYEYHNHNGLLAAYVYDSLSNQTHEIQAPGYNSSNSLLLVDNESIVNEKVYNAAGKMTNEINGEEEDTKFSYNAEGEISSVTLPNEVTTSYTYNKVTVDSSTGELTKKDITVHANGSISEIIKNRADQEVEIKDIAASSSISTKFEYDPKGNKIKEIYSNDKYKEFEYDAKDRLVCTTAFEASDKTSYKAELSYDKNDNITLMKDSKYVGSSYVLDRYTACEYDFMGRLISKAELDGPNTPQKLKSTQRNLHTPMMLTIT